MGTFKVSGYFREEDGYVHAVSSDGRFVGYGATQEEALNYMKDLLASHRDLCQRHGLDPAEDTRTPEWKIV